MTYIQHLIYGDWPSIIIRDDKTLDAFSRNSPWAYSSSDSPFTVIPDMTMGNETHADNEQRNNILKEFMESE